VKIRSESKSLPGETEMFSDSAADAGPKSGGTYNVPADAASPRGVDTAGNSPGVYSRDILDLFRLGLGAYRIRQEDKYRQREHERMMEQEYLYSRGQQSAFFGGNGQIGILGIGALVLILLLAK
jgi:hypothetical protein